MDKNKLIGIFKSKGIEVQDKTLVYIKDAGIVKNILSDIEGNSILLGMDLYDGTCSGDITIRMENHEYIRVIEKDNSHDDICKFLSLIVIFDSLSDKTSPIIFFESAYDCINDKKYKERGYQYIREDAYLELKIDNNRETVFEKEKVDYYKQLEEVSLYDKEIVVPNFRENTRHINSGMFMYANLQHYIRTIDGNMFIYKYHNSTSEQIINSLFENYNIIKI